VLAVTDRARAALMPAVPTTAEAALPDLVSFGWFALVAPPNTTAWLQNEIAAASIQALKMADVQEKLRALAVEPVATSPAETAAFIKEEAMRWGKVIKDTGIVVD